MNNLINCVLALIALINPVSKVFIVSLLAENASVEETRKISIRATFIALIILVVFALTGNFILRSIFQVEIYAFQIVGGGVLVYRGFLALNKGLFFESDVNQKLEEASIVPLASPLIAGPATLTAAVTFPQHYGLGITLIAIIVSLSINLILMLSAKRIGRALKRYNLMGALIRITGLIVATIGMQLMLNGIRTYGLGFGGIH